MYLSLFLVASCFDEFVYVLLPGCLFIRVFRLCFHIQFTLAVSLSLDFVSLKLISMHCVYLSVAYASFFFSRVRVRMIACVLLVTSNFRFSQNPLSVFVKILLMYFFSKIRKHRDSPTTIYCLQIYTSIILAVHEAQKTFFLGKNHTD